MTRRRLSLRGSWLSSPGGLTRLCSSLMLNKLVVNACQRKMVSMFSEDFRAGLQKMQVNRVMFTVVNTAGVREPWTDHPHRPKPSSSGSPARQPESPSRTPKRAGVSVARWSQIEAGSEMRHGHGEPGTGRPARSPAWRMPFISPERLETEGRRPDAAETSPSRVRQKDPAAATAAAADEIPVTRQGAARGLPLSPPRTESRIAANDPTWSRGGSGFRESTRQPASWAAPAPASCPSRPRSPGPRKYCPDQGAAIFTAESE